MCVCVCVCVCVCEEGAEAAEGGGVEWFVLISGNNFFHPKSTSS